MNSCDVFSIAATSVFVIVFLWLSVFLQSTTIGIHVRNTYTCNMSTVTLSLKSFDELAPPSSV